MISAASSLVAKCVLVNIGFGKKKEQLLGRLVGWLVYRNLLLCGMWVAGNTGAGSMCLRLV